MGRTMNWRRRLLRLWLVLSLCWIAGIGVYAWKQEPGISSSQFGYEIASSPEKQNGKEIGGSLNAELAKRYVAYVLLPPLITLALGLSAHGWCRTSSARVRSRGTAEGSVPGHERRMAASRRARQRWQRWQRAGGARANAL
jgi:hypothetical protein